MFEYILLIIFSVFLSTIIILFNFGLYLSFLLYIIFLIDEIPKDIHMYNHQANTFIIKIHYFIGVFIALLLISPIIKYMSIISIYPIFEILKFLGI